jgi:hypothetical protein
LTPIWKLGRYTDDNFSSESRPSTALACRPRDTQTLDALFDAFAEAWHFPPWFGRNGAAFDDFMRDLHNMIEASMRKPPAPGYLTQITDAHLILAGQPEAFAWFAKCMPFYRDYYRDEASPPATFGLLVSAPPDQLSEVRGRWLAVDVPVATLTV